MRNLDLHGKTATVFGVADHRSLAWHIAKTLDAQGCRVAVGFQERHRDKAREIIRQLHDPLPVMCELTEDESIEDFFGQVKSEFGKVDAVIHSVAFCKRQYLDGKYLEIPRKDFLRAQEVSAYTLTAVTKAAEQLLSENASIITLSYLGADLAVPGYNVMGVCKAALEASVRYLAADLGERGIRVNAISAGPVFTGAAAGIANFRSILKEAAEKSPMKRKIAPEDVADLALFLVSDLARNITGQTIFVDAGCSIMGNK